MSTVLVTGCAGFIGSHICRELQKNGHRVIGIDDFSGGFAENVPMGVKLLEVDITDSYTVAEIFKKHQPDFVIHAAAYAAEGLSHFIRVYNYENNLRGSINLINGAVNFNVKSFVFLSSIAVYGHQTPPFTEAMIPAPADPYAVAKYAVELDLKAAHAMFGLPYVIFRPYNVYGENQNIGDAYRNVVGIFMNQILKGEPLTIFGDGSQTRAFSHVSDVAPAIAASIDRPETWNQVFNIGGLQPCSVRELAERVSVAMGVKSHPIHHLPPRQEALHAFCLRANAFSYFADLMPNVPLSEGLERMAQWVQRHGARSTKKFTFIEIEKNLPPSWTELQ